MTPTRTPRYRQIGEELRRQILSGVYRPGDRLPTETELARLFGVSRVTSAAAMAELAREGLVDRAPRRGTVVRLQPPKRLADARPLIAWIQPGLDHSLGLYLLEGIERAVRAAGYNLLLHLTGSSQEEEAVAIRQALAAGAAGIALFLQDGETYNAEVLRLVLDRFPIVLVDRYLRGVPCASVGSDSIGGARMLVEELVRAGHRHICAVAYPAKGTSTIEDRLEGYSLALAAAGIALDRSLVYTEEQLRDRPAPWSIPEAFVERFAAFLRARPEITGIFATNTSVALLALRAAERLGLRIPQDLSLVCIDALETFPISLPALTCALQPAAEIGTTALDLLREGLAGAPPRRVLLPMQLSRAGSVGPPARPRATVG